MLRTRILPTAVLLLASGASQAQDSREYYLYQRSAAPSALHMDAEFATGTREAGVFGRHGVEGLLRTGMTLGDRWTVEGAFGAVEDRDADERATGWSAEARYTLTDRDSDSGLAFGGGYRRDYDGVSIPFARLVGEHAFAHWNVAANALVELPQSADRDSADLIMSVGASYATSATVRLGFEFAVEDLEGFFDEEEAEGGAKFILGPTMNWRMWSGQITRWHVGWVYAATANAPANADAPDYRGRRNGLLARVAFGFGR